MILPALGKLVINPLFTGSYKDTADRPPAGLYPGYNQKNHCSGQGPAAIIFSVVFTVLSSAAATTSEPTLRSDKITVDLRYRHGDLEVAYPIECAANKTCTLSSLAGANHTWQVAVTPARLPNGILSLTTVVHEQGKEVSRSEILAKTGEEVRLVSAGENDDHTELVVKAF